MKYEVTVSGHDHIYVIDIDEENRIVVDGEVVDIDFAGMGVSGLYSLLVNHESFESMVEYRDERWDVLLRGHLYEVEITDERSRRLNARAKNVVQDTGEIAIKSPMPGRIVSIPVAVGQEIKKGQNLVILESMKMENELKAPRDGLIERVLVAQGDSVEQGHVLLVMS